METSEIRSLPTAEVERQLPHAHPSAYLIYANRAWDEGRRDDAVFWFYVGQLRYRFHVAAHPALKAGGDPALFSSLFATIGPAVNRYAGSDIPNIYLAPPTTVASTEPGAPKYTLWRIARRLPPAVPVAAPVGASPSPP